MLDKRLPFFIVTLSIFLIFHATLLLLLQSKYCSEKPHIRKFMFVKCAAYFTIFSYSYLILYLS